MMVFASACRRVAVVVAFLLVAFGLAAAPAQAIGGGSTVSMSIVGYGAIDVGTASTSPPNCTTPASTPGATSANADAGVAVSCASFDAANADACTTEGVTGDTVTRCSVTLTAVVEDAGGWAFDHWSGDCSGTSPTCTDTTSVTECITGDKPPCQTDYSDVAAVAHFRDTRAPTTTFTQAPGQNSVVYSDTQSQMFTWSTNEDAEAPAFVCKKDLGFSAGCSSGITWSSITDGVHDFCVHGTDASGLSGSDACRHWEQETNPTASISKAPDPTTSSGDVSFTYTSNKTVHQVDGSALSYLCRMDDAAFVACPASGTAYSALANGSHTFQVEAVFTAAFGGGAHTSAPASYPFTVADTTGPTVTPTNPPSGVVLSSTLAQTISWTSDDPDGPTYTCTLDAGPTQPCTSPANLTGLADGVHHFFITGQDYHGNTGQTVDVEWDQEIPAGVVIDSGPTAGSTITTASPTFTFHSPKAHVTFQCRYGGAAFGACSGNGSDKVSGLSAGQHTFGVRARWVSPLDHLVRYGAAASRTFTVLKAPSCTIGVVSTKVVGGRISLRIKCGQPGTAVVGGTVTEIVSKTQQKHFTLATVKKTVKTNTTVTVTLSIGAAWTPLKAGKHETAVFSVTGSNAAGKITHKTAAVTLRH